MRGSSRNATSQTEETKKLSWIPVGPEIIRTAGEDRRKTYSKEGGNFKKKEHKKE